mgnify:CR=1 FL=1
MGTPTPRVNDGKRLSDREACCFKTDSSKMEERFWQQTITAVAAYFGVQTTPTTQLTCVDPGRKWSQAGNIWHNAGIRTVLYQVSTPLRLLRKPFSKPRA